jgi:hypothetical protein
MAPGAHRRTYALVLETESHSLTRKSKLNHRAAEHRLPLAEALLPAVGARKRTFNAIWSARCMAETVEALFAVHSQGARWGV